MRLPFTVVLLTGVLLSACGGGGSGGSDNTPAPPPTPTTVSTPTFYPGDIDIPVTGADVPGIAALDTSLKAIMKRYNVPGIGLAVTRDGRLILARAYGYQDFEARQPMRPDTMVRVGSISKFITALAIMRLRDQGQLDLDQTFLSILTDYQVAAGGDARLRDITLRMLLLHAGGWAAASEAEDFTSKPFVVANALGVPTPPTCRDVIRYTMTQPLQFTPGTKIVYSNTGYCILGEVVAKVSGQSYESYVRDQILARADVHAMSIAMPHQSQRGPLEAKYYIFNGSRLVDSTFVGEGKVPLTYSGDPITGEGAFGWLGSPVDLTRIMTAFEGTRVANFIPTSSKAEMMIDTHLPDAALVGTPRYRWRGLGLVVGPTTETYAHGGLATGSQTAFHRTESGHTFTIVTNIRVDKSDDLYNELVTAVEDSFATLPADPSLDLYPQYPSMSLPARNP
jgi:CubicO group peptidase (beta-lactamase class C family)